MPKTTDMDNKVAIVVGASSGIGSATARRLAERGAGVILTYNANRPGADRVVRDIAAAGGTAVALALDVGDSDGFGPFVERVAVELYARWQRDTFDLLVNNAGFGQAEPFADMTEWLFDDLHRVLFRGPYFLTQQLLPLLADGGAIVNTTSNSALPTIAEPGYSAYASMKGALAVATRYLAKELAERGIRVNAIAPGPTRTRLGGDAFERFPELIPPLVQRTALGRLGEPEDVGKVIAALLSDDCGWVTGQQLEVSGGYDL